MYVNACMMLDRLGPHGSFEVSLADRCKLWDRGRDVCHHTHHLWLASHGQQEELSRSVSQSFCRQQPSVV